MPELPEVETTRAGIAPHVEGQQITSLIVRNARLRWPVPEQLSNLIEAGSIGCLRRRAKYLLMPIVQQGQEQGCLLWHLGMSGSLRIISAGETVAKHDHIDLLLANGKALRYHDPRRFGACLWLPRPDDGVYETCEWLAHLGPEPLSEHFNGAYLYQQSRKRRQTLKAFIMDNRTVVGVGNIYANEALFAAGLHPTKAAGKLTRAASETLAAEIKQVLAQAIAQGGTSLKDFVGGDGKPGYFQQQLNVYGRAGKPCRVCAKPLLERQIAKRTTVYCTQCQH